MYFESDSFDIHKLRDELIISSSYTINIKSLLYFILRDELFYRIW